MISVVACKILRTMAQMITSALDCPGRVKYAQYAKISCYKSRGVPRSIILELWAALFAVTFIAITPRGILLAEGDVQDQPASIEEVRITISQSKVGITNKQVSSDVVNDPPKSVPPGQFLIETGIAACANAGLAAFFNEVNGATMESDPFEPAPYDLLKYEIRNVNIERQQRRVAGYVYGGDSTTVTEDITKETLTELPTNDDNEPVEIPEVYSVLISWTDVRGIGAQRYGEAITYSSDPTVLLSKQRKLKHIARHLSPTKLSELWRKATPYLRAYGSSYKATGLRIPFTHLDTGSLLDGEPWDLLHNFQVPRVFEYDKDVGANTEQYYLSNINTIGIAKHPAALGSGVLTIPFRNWVHDKMVEIANANGWSHPETMTHGEYNKFFFKTYFDHVIAHGYTDVPDDADKDVLAWRGTEARVGPDLFYTTYFAVQTCKKPPVRVLSADATGTKAYDNLTAREVLEDLQKMIHVPADIIDEKTGAFNIRDDDDNSKIDPDKLLPIGAHPRITPWGSTLDATEKQKNIDSEAIYQVIEGSAATIPDGVVDFDDISQRYENHATDDAKASEKISVFWIAYHIFSSLCLIDTVPDVRKDSEKNLLHKNETIPCDRKSLLTNSFDEKPFGDSNFSEYRVDQRLSAIMQIFRNALVGAQTARDRRKVKESFETYRTHKRDHLDGISNMLGHMRKLLHCSQFKERLAFWARHDIDPDLIGGYFHGDSGNSIRAWARKHYKTVYGFTPKYWEHTDLGHTCQLIEKLGAKWYEKNPGGKVKMWVEDGTEEGAKKDFTLYDFVTYGSRGNVHIASVGHVFQIEDKRTWSGFLLSSTQKIHDRGVDGVDGVEGETRVDTETRIKQVCGTPKTAGEDPCDPNTELKEYDPDTDPDMVRGNIVVFTEYLETMRQIAKAAARFDDRQIRINMQKRQLVSCSLHSSSHHSYNLPLSSNEATGKILASGYLDMRQAFPGQSFKGNTEYYSRHPESNLGIEPAWQQLNIKDSSFVTFLNTAKFPLDPEQAKKVGSITPSGYPYHSLPGRDYVPPAMLDSRTGGSRHRWGQFGVHYRSYPRSICSKTTINQYLVDNAVVPHQNEGFCKLHFGQVYPRRKMRKAFLNFVRKTVNDTLVQMRQSYKAANPGATVDTADASDPSWCSDNILTQQLNKINAAYRNKNFNNGAGVSGPITVEREVSLRSFKKCLCDQEIGISYRN